MTRVAEMAMGEAGLVTNDGGYGTLPHPCWSRGKVIDGGDVWDQEWV